MSPNKVGSRAEDNLTVSEAFSVMTLFLHQFADRAAPDLLTLLGDISLWKNTTTDPAAWEDWLVCVAHAKEKGLSGPLSWGHEERTNI